MAIYPKPPILDQVGSSHCVIEASAGTGKTFTLEHLVVQFLLEGIPLEKILVVTFTKKATLELISRVRAKLEELVALEQDSAPADGPSWRIGDEQRRLLQQALQAFDRATIATIHGFCQQVLKDAAFEGARLFQQEAISSDEAFDRAFREMLRAGYAVRDKARFELALEALGGVEKLRQLLKEAARERDCLVSHDAAALLRAFPSGLAEAFIAETNTGPLRSAFKAANCSPQSFSHMSKRLQVVLDGIAKVGQGAPPEVVWMGAEDLESQAKNFRRDGLSGEAALLAEGYLSLMVDPKALWVSAFLPPLLEAVEELKAREGFYDFDDMIHLVHQAVCSEAGAPLVGRLRKRYQVALIDEFQDTDARQWGIFRKVFLESTEGHRLILVGDPKQAIYGFRSGDLPTYTRATEAVRQITGCEPLQLTRNFRSTPEMIEICNQIFEPGEEEAFFTGGNGPHYRAGVDCGRRSLALRDRAGKDVPPIRVVDVPIGGAAATKRLCAARLAALLKEALGNLSFGSGEDMRPVAPEDVLVLTRTGAEGLLMARALKQAGVPAAFYKQDGLFDGPEAKACRDLLLAVENPYHESRRAKALLGPFFGLTFSEAEGCRELAENHPILRRLFQWRDSAQAGRWGEFFSRIVSESGVTQRLLFLEAGQRTLTNLLHILELLQQESLSRHGTLLDLAIQTQRWIDGLERPAVEDGETQRLERASGAVQILTMHKSKGLEAPVVVLFGGLSKGLPPTVHRYHEGGGGDRRAWVGSLKYAPEDVSAWIESEEVEEGERLLYVALTRAKGHLILPRFVPGAAEVNGNSSFLPSGDPKAAYGCVNRRLRSLMGPAEQPRIHPRIRRADEAWTEPTQGEEATERVRAWRPEPPPLIPSPDFDALRTKGRPVWFWSYTSLQKGMEGLERRDDDPEVYSEPPSAYSKGLRGGAKLGSLVHTCFERMDLQTFDGRDFDAWRRDPRVQALAEDLLPAEVQVGALAWVHAGLGGELPLPGGGHAVLARCERILRELDFVTPYPVGKDLLHGSIDVLFEWEGRAHVLDWKTNDLEGAYDPETLQRKMEEGYLLQVKIYTLTACRFLGIETEEAYEQRFGGVVYVFLRGLPSEGVWTLRPSWTEVQGWERELRSLPLERLIPAHAGGSHDA